ncbi:exocyst complex component 7-like [Lethenteron reissneri]|uniref:exocyst complex component 7-like n=1 Tax=Lethenteron reissneri TaxID=7753 RepID=UPI002AB6CA42|nr:exocyst complex component 7-like [Lethenteron reissneri]XP_061425776.1 exocyst complex component 7-like [Lethenteron reissneri]XP_061425777.1 exocyst complex component 7-like [Lethenteron reissneri]
MDHGTSTLRRRMVDIDGGIEKDESELEWLLENLRKNDQLTDHMVNVVESFERRLLKLENAIMPVYRETEALKQLQKATEMTLSSIDHIIAHYHVASETQQFIKEGAAARLEEFLAVLERLHGAARFFSVSHPGSVELSQVRGLLERGSAALEVEFVSVLSRRSNPVPPGLTAELAEADGDWWTREDSEGARRVEHLPEGAARELARIASWLGTHSDSLEFLKSYQQIRSRVLLRSMSELREHHQKLGVRLARPLTAPLLSARKPNKKIGSMIVLPSVQRLQSLSKSDRRKSISDLTSVEAMEDSLELDAQLYLPCIPGFLKLAMSEFHLLEQILPTHHHATAFEKLLWDAMDKLITDAEKIASSAKRAAERRNFFVISPLFAVIRRLKSCQRGFNIVLQITSSAIKDRVPLLISNMEAAGFGLLEGFTSYIKSGSGKDYTVPKDGTVHELSSAVILFLREVLDFQEIAGGILSSQGYQHSSLEKNVGAAEKEQICLSAYICSARSRVERALAAMAHVYEDSALGAVFLINNYNYLRCSLRSFGLLPLIELTEAGTDGAYEGLIEEQIVVYKKSWRKLLDHITVSGLPSLEPGSKIKSKERKMIKDKLSAFNNGLEELCKVQRTWAIPDRDLRAKLYGEGKPGVVAAYGSFLERFASVSFSKNPSKYIRYSVEQVAGLLDGRFDATA